MADSSTRVATSAQEVEVAPNTRTPAKVELDLDDAPFLQVEDSAPPAPVEENEPPAEEKPANDKKRKLVLLGAIGAFFLLTAAVAVWWFFFRTPPPAPPPPLDPEIIVVPSTPPPLADQDIVHEFAVFVVPVNDDRSQTAFLVCKFAAITKDASVDQEMTRQEIPLRDAVYYYLRGKDAGYLQDAHNYDAIKQDLLAVFNDYLSQGKLEDIVFESYLSH